MNSWLRFIKDSIDFALRGMNEMKMGHRMANWQLNYERENIVDM